MLCISSFIRSLAVSSSFFSSFLYLKLSFVLLFDCKVKKKTIPVWILAKKVSFFNLFYPFCEYLLHKPNLYCDFASQRLL